MESSNILIVEDDAAHAELISLAFEPDAEFSLQVTPCLREARAAIAECSPELVITDLLLPDGRGIDLLPAAGRPLDFPIVVMTGHGDEKMAVEAMKAGAVNYVVKSAQSLADLPRIATSTLREWDHVVERRKEKQALLASEKRYRALFEDNPSMFFTVNAAGIVVSANRFAADHLGREVEEMVGRPLSEIHVEAEQAAIGRYLGGCFREPSLLHRWDTCQERRDGTPIWVNVTARVVESAGVDALALMVCDDVTAARRHSDHLVYHAGQDPLTGLADRRQFERSLQQALSAARTEQAEHALCYLDLDQLEAVNDSRGHVAGDELLRRLSNLLKRTVRKHDVLARLGGDEFGILLTDCSTINAMRVVKSLLQAVDAFRLPGQSQSLDIGVSVGLVTIDEASGDSAALLAAAADACVAAKRRGRNGVHLHSADDDAVSLPAGGESSRPTVGMWGPAVDISNDPARPWAAQNASRSSDADFAGLVPNEYRILHVDDDPVSRMMTEGGLKMAGFEVWSAESGEQALELMAERGFPHLALVDIFMPGMSGPELCRKIQASADLPIIMVTSVDDSETEEETLREVAEDYVTKPFDLPVLVARIGRLLRRMGTFAYAQGPRIRVDDRLEVELGCRRVHVEGEQVELTRTETKLLYILMRNAGQTVTSDFLLRRIWPHEEIFENVLRTHVGRLRKKIERLPGRPRYVMTRRGMGYFFKAKEQAR